MLHMLVILTVGNENEQFQLQRMQVELYMDVMVIHQSLQYIETTEVENLFELRSKL